MQVPGQRWGALLARRGCHRSHSKQAAHPPACVVTCKLLVSHLSTSPAPPPLAWCVSACAWPWQDAWQQSPYRRVCQPRCRTEQIRPTSACRHVFGRVLISPAQISHRCATQRKGKLMLTVTVASRNSPPHQYSYSSLPAQRSAHPTPCACQLCIMESYLCGTCVLH
jgi:hypothetical protein